MKQKKDDNKEYFGYLEPTFYIIFYRPNNSESILKIKNKLKGINLEIFDKIYFNYQLKRLTYELNQEALREYINFEKISSLKEIMENGEPYFEKRRRTNQAKKEVEVLFDTYLESINRMVFLEAISEITYWIAKLEILRQIEIHKTYLSSWAQWHKYLERKNKNKREGEKIKEKLRIILGDAVDNFEKIEEEYIKNVERFKAGKENIFVNIDYEIDVNNTIPNDSLIIPNRWLGEKEDFRVIEENTICVTLDNKKYTLKSYYEKIKIEINKEWFVSRDILKQIITVYLIKRCQNGDGEAFKILYNLYESRAKKTSEDFIKTYKNIPNIEDVEGNELSILTSLLKGDTPAFIYKTLSHGRSDKIYNNSLNKKPYVALNESYEMIFSLISNQYNRLNTLLVELQKGTKECRNRAKSCKKMETKEKYYEQIISYSSQILSKVEFMQTTFMIVNPIDLLKISPNYNKFLFKPTPKGNLTTWLFGSGRKDTFKGMVWESLSNLTKSWKNDVSVESFDENEIKIDEEGFGVKIRKIQDIN